ncbi:MAG: hypothetical protein SGJ03_12420, partial [Alphaproteobacteria bacterium]|nr:hypothetical protein [Alphaproteobacteria bacterium]
RSAKRQPENHLFLSKAIAQIRRLKMNLLMDGLILRLALADGSAGTRLEPTPGWSGLRKKCHAALLPPARKYD